MKLGIMQPYFFPYIGYWQLMNAVDKYVVYDDVNYIKGGWINRNRILINGKPSFFNLPILGAGSNKRINELSINNDSIIWRKLFRTLEMSYGRAPHFKRMMPVIEEVLTCEIESVSLFLLNSFQVVNRYLGIDTELMLSSNIPKDNALKGQDKILDICSILGATEYYNAIGGVHLYSTEAFSVRGIQLKFLRTKELRYKQFGNEFEPNLSIIDVMMFCSVDEIRDMLSDFEIIC